VSVPPPAAAAPGETRIPPAGTSLEDELPLSRGQREAALAHLRDVAACARALGADVPDPVSDGEGVHLSWSGPERPAWEAALARCDDLAAPRSGDEELPPR
jgi:sugar phosphate isomerase/epimerase